MAKAKKSETVIAALPIVGLGASAGGLEAITELLRRLPPDTGMAYVLVQHLDPKHESALPILLARETGMPVLQVKDRMRVKPDHVYVIPPNTNLTVSQGVLHLAPRTVSHGVHLPVDTFLTSLAQDQGGHAVGVILSGTASDGTLGCRAIKAEGGITIAQDKKSAKYFGMPGNAIASGYVDLVLPPEGIAKELARIGAHPYLKHSDATVALPVQAPQTEELYQQLFTMIRAATGVDFSLYKPSTLRRRIMKRMLLGHQETLEDYVKYLRENRAEIQQLFQDFLINVTAFFRDPEAFEELSKTVFPAIVGTHGPDVPIRIWVPGCATGEEVYSVAICILEYLRDNQLDLPIQVFGTDIAESALEKARAGVYPESIANNVTPDRLRRFFTKGSQGYQINTRVRQLCVFARHDLVKDPPFSKLDLVSCCNVLIYLGRPLQTRVLSTFHYALKPGGILMLGPTESLGTQITLFSSMDKKHKFYARSNVTSPAFDWTAPEEIGRTGGKRVAALKEWTDAEIGRKAEEILLARYGPAGILVDQEGRIIQFHGHTGPYLEPASGEASLSVLKMARPGLEPEIRSLLQQARRTLKTVRKENVSFKSNGDYRVIVVTITPIASRMAKLPHFLITFEEAVKPPEPESRKVHAKTRKGDLVEREIARLREELDSTRQQLQSIIEEQEAANEDLKSASEEIQSSNEELQSTNEELETAKEELQSTNEELVTLNEELQTRNTELTQVNNDLNNLLSSVNIPIIMLGPELRLRRYTPQADKIFRLIPGDVGRSILDVEAHVDAPELKETLHAVAENLTPIEREVHDRSGRCYSMWVRPYKTMDNKIDGTVLSFVDIDTLARNLEDTRHALDYVKSIVESVRQPLLVLDSDLRIKTANHSFCQFFRIPRADAEGQLLPQLDGGVWNIPELRLLIEKTLRGESVLEEVEAEIDFERIGHKALLVNTRTIDQPGDHHLMLLAIEDVTDRKRTAAVRYRRVFEAAGDGILVVDADSGQILDVNAATVELLGYPWAGLVGTPVWEAPPFQENELGRSMYLLLQKKNSVYYGALQLPRQDGGRLDVELSGNLYLEGEHKVIELNIRDISQRRQAEERLKASLNEKETLLKELHHRVKNNLQIISSLLNLQAEYVKDQQTLDMFNESRNRVRSIALIHEILYESKSLSSIEMSEYIGTLAQTLVRSFGIDPAIIRLNIDAAGVSLGVDQAFPCGLVLNELITNALKHAFPGGREGEIQVSLSDEDGRHRLVVQDNGVGLPDGFPKTETLGLQLVQTLVGQLNGTLAIDRGRGTRFEIVF